MFKTQKYGWVRDLPDHRDHKYTAVEPFATLPKKVDLRPQCPPVYDQGQIGSCTANSLAGLIQFDELKEKVSKPFIPSRLFIYYNERVLEYSVKSDSGAQLRDGIKALVKWGCAPESEWPYVESKFATKPTKAVYKDALKVQIQQYQSIPQNEQSLKSCLASGFPVVFGFSVYESFESDEVAKTGVVPLPTQDEQMVGGHAVCCVGYDDAERVFIVRNSWGPDWGLKGYFLFPYAYMLSPDLSSDFWTIRFVKE